jgi:hypothetical protein
MFENIKIREAGARWLQETHDALQALKTFLGGQQFVSK